MKHLTTIVVVLSSVLIIGGCLSDTAKQATDNKGAGGVVSSRPYNPPPYQPPPPRASQTPIIQAQAQQFALVIGNKRYEHMPLTNTVNDANDVASQLGYIGFEVTLKTDLIQSEMMKAIRAFAKRLSENQNAIGWFYFSGLGSRVGGENYLEPIENDKIMDEDDLVSYAIPASKILRKMQKAKTQLNIMILDACRNNPYRSAARSGSRGLAQMQSSKGTIISFATAAGNTAKDLSQNGRNGLYTSHLLKGLETAYENHLRIDDMFMQVNNAVMQESGGKPDPWYSASLKMPFCFGGCQSETRQQAEIDRLKLEAEAAKRQAEDERLARLEVQEKAEAAKRQAEYERRKADAKRLARLVSFFFTILLGW